jgi:type II secretory ATPase GspE/PulE/Tfp pilus assembly ATPase PilB-like protein
MPDIKNKLFYLSRTQEERHTEEIAKKLNLPYINLVGYPLTEEILNFVPEENAIQYKIIPYLKVGKSIKIASVRPNDPNLKIFLDQFSKTIGVSFALTVISESSLIYGISIYEQNRKVKAKVVSDQVKEEEESFDEKISDLKSASAILQKVTTTKLLDTIVLGAVKTKSSDIHIEPAEKDFLIRYRIDGILQDVVTLSLLQYKQLIARIKYLSKLRMDIVDQPQDGRFSIKTAKGEEIDLRISIMPSTWGESVVVRLLGQEKSILTLESLGFRPDALAVVKAAISKPYGMILTSGPTGSGKSSTLYAILTELNKPGVKIITLENPVEYRIEGIEQSQMKPGAGYEFADGLKASLRQDPDILMVGEIRDEETAEIAVQAALTGHLLLSTIHANSAPAVFARLIEIGVKPFLLSGSVNLIMAQRLVRKICTHCREQYSPNPEIWQEVTKALIPIKNRLSANLQNILMSPKPVLVRGKGCEFCNKSGYIGREVIVEVLVPDDTIETFIARKATISEFVKAAAAQGMITMEQDGLSKALMGSTTIEEVWRVTRS